MAYSTVTVQDSISADTHWTCGQQYLLKGYVYVTAGHTLTIDGGTIIRGDKDSKGTLIIERGAKIIANATAASPIVFTSNQDAGDRTYGDWGGVILCGQAPVNWTAGQAQVEGGPRSFYGGSIPNDNSGIMRYVRIEYAGIAFSPNNEVNGLTLCGVGNATEIDHIQVSYSGDDAYEFFGGTVNTHHMVAYATWDDDFDTDNGYQGKGQFLSIIRNPNAADQSGSKGFESDSYLAGTYTGLATPVDLTKMNRGIFSNVTAIGPLVSPTSTAYDPQYTAGVHLRRGSGMSILNSIIAGWPCGVLIDESSASFGSTTANIASEELQFRNNIICGNPTFAGGPAKDIMYVKDGARNQTSTAANADTTTGSPFAPFAGPYSFLRNYDFHNKTYATEQTGVKLVNPFFATGSNPVLVPLSASPVVYSTLTVGGVAHPYNAALPINTDTSGNYANYNAPDVFPDFTTTKASDAFFTRVNYIGAFAFTGSTSDNWMNGWCEFDPNNADYDTTCYVPPIVNAVNNVPHSTIAAATVYPNPTNGIATVSLMVKRSGDVSITVMDLTGKTVQQVYNGQTAQGEQKYSFSTDNLANGMYVISITADGKQKSLKFFVAK